MIVLSAKVDIKIKFTNGFGNIFLQNGKIQIKSINISYARVMRDDFYIISSDSAKSNTSFSTFFNATSGHRKRFYKNKVQFFEQLFDYRLLLN